MVCVCSIFNMSGHFDYCGFWCLTSILVCTIVLLFYIFIWMFTKNYSYWKDRNVPYIEPSFFFGNIKEQILRKKSNKHFVNKCYDTFKNIGYGGVFHLTSPALYICKPDLIDKVLVEDFSCFHDRLSKEDGCYPLMNTLSYCNGEQWKTLRSKIAPAFCLGKVRGMFEQILCGTDRVVRKLGDLPEGSGSVEVENMATVYATEVLASCMFGVEVSNTDQYQQLEESLDVIYNPSLIRYIIMVLGFVNVKLYNRLKLQRVPKKAMYTFSSLISDIVTYREQKVTKRDDVLQTILDLKSQEKANTGKPNPEQTSNDGVEKNTRQKFGNFKHGNLFTETRISSLMFNFMTAGIKPTSVTITFALYEIARNPVVQERLQKEISEALRKHGGWSYEALLDMSYLDLVIQETLRLHSFNLVVVRSVTRPYTLPGTAVTLEKDTMVFVPVVGLHRDPAFYPSPEEFRPERWENNRYRASCVYLPFGRGPRACVSVDLAVLVAKLCLARVVAQHHVSVASGATPLVMDEGVFYPKVKGGMCLAFSKRQMV